MGFTRGDDPQDRPGAGTVRWRYALAHLDAAKNALLSSCPNARRGSEWLHVPCTSLSLIPNPERLITEGGGIRHYGRE